LQFNIITGRPALGGTDDRKLHRTAGHAAIYTLTYLNAKQGESCFFVAMGGEISDGALEGLSINLHGQSLADAI
jgi:hypothetical protein